MADLGPNTAFSEKEKEIAERIYNLMLGAGYGEDIARDICVIVDPAALEPHVEKLCRLRQREKDPFRWLRAQLWPKSKKLERR